MTKKLHVSTNFRPDQDFSDDEVMNQLESAKFVWEEYKRDRQEAWTAKAKEIMSAKVKVKAKSACGRLPRGYKSVRKNGRIIAELDPACSSQVQRALKLAATGTYSVSRLCKRMAEHGLVARNGKAPSQASMWKILTNPYYCGIVRWKGELLPGAQPKLLSQDEFDAIQKHLQRI